MQDRGHDGIHVARFLGCKLQGCEGCLYLVKLLYIVKTCHRSASTMGEVLEAFRSRQVQLLLHGRGRGAAKHVEDVVVAFIGPRGHDAGFF